MPRIKLYCTTVCCQARLADPKDDYCAACRRGIEARTREVRERKVARDRTRQPTVPKEDRIGMARLRPARIGRRG